jgi:para-aminobenzoate synthetase component 2
LQSVVIIDHFDSFVFNIARYVKELGFNAKVYRCDEVSVADVLKLHPSHLIFSPGPCGPNETGISHELMFEALGVIPILGVCLGSLVLYSLCGGKIGGAVMPRHGKSILLAYAADPLFSGMTKFMQVGLYHSLIMQDEVPSCLKVLSRCQSDQIMAVKHRDFIAYGLQFHPESILTLQGSKLLANFLSMRY